jgi:hypothetical protein
MSKHYEVKAVMPHPSYENKIPPSFYKASQENVDFIFRSGATQLGVYCVENDNRRFVKYLYEPSLYEEVS